MCRSCAAIRARPPCSWRSSERRSTDRSRAQRAQGRPDVALAGRCLSAAGGIQPHHAPCPSLPEVPTARELTQDPKALSLIAFAEDPFFMALPIAAPPDLPADRAKALQTAFVEMSKDPAFVSDAQKLGSM